MSGSIAGLSSTWGSRFLLGQHRRQILDVAELLFVIQSSHQFFLAYCQTRKNIKYSVAKISRAFALLSQEEVENTSELFPKAL